MLRKVIFGLFIVIAIAATAAAYMYLRSVKEPRENVMHLIPADCSFILECDNYPSLSKKILKNSLIWEEMKQEAFYSQQDSSLSLLDSLLSTNDTLIGLFKNTRLYLAGYQQPNSFEYLLAFNLPALNKNIPFLAFLRNHCYKMEETKLPGGEQVMRLQISESDQPLFLYSSAGIVVIGNTELLMDKALKKENPISGDLHFIKLEEDGGNNMDFRIYFRSGFYASVFSPSFYKNFPIKNNSQWTALDFLNSPNELTLNGFMDSDSTRLLDLLKNQEPVEFNFQFSIPRTSLSFSYLGISDYKKFAQGAIENNGALSERNISLSENTGSGLINEWAEIFSGQLALVQTPIESAITPFGIASINDSENALGFLKEFSDSLSRVDTSKSRVIRINKNLFPTITCDILNESFSTACIFNDYVIFAKSDTLATKFIRDIESYGSLGKSDRFEPTFNTNLSKDCNYYFYSDLSTNYANTLEIFNPAVFANFKSPETHLKKFGFLGTQLSSHKGKILSQTCLHYNPDTKQQSLTLWETQLDTISTSSPQLLINHKNGSNEYFISDEKGTIYLISNTGKLQWKKALGEKVMSKVYQVDYYKNGKLQMLFNTTNYIHLIDRNGNYVTGYPIKLAHSTTNALAVFDYENTKEYRILIACADKHIYNYSIAGKQVEGFNFPETKAEVKLPVDFRRINAKDYLIVCDDEGNVYGTSRKGETRLTLTNKLPEKCTEYHLSIGKDISKSILYAFDKNQPSFELLSLDNKIDRKEYNSEVKPKHTHLAFVNEDKLIDCIISDETGFEVIDDAGIKILSYISKTDLLPGTSCIYYDNQLYFLMITSENKLQVIDISGNLLSENGYIFSQLPILSYLNNDGKPFLLGVNKDKLNCYSFQP